MNVNGEKRIQWRNEKNYKLKFKWKSKFPFHFCWIGTAQIIDIEIKEKGVDSRNNKLNMIY